MTNSDRLQEIRERAEKATPGPWMLAPTWDIRYVAEVGPIFINPADPALLVEEVEVDATFIAEARSDIPYLLQLVTEQREVLDSAVRFIESALVICARSCNPGDGLHVSWGEDICKAARALGPLNALEELRQKNEAKGYRKQERPM